MEDSLEPFIAGYFLGGVGFPLHKPYPCSLYHGEDSNDRVATPFEQSHDSSWLVKKWIRK